MTPASPTTTRGPTRRRARGPLPLLPGARWLAALAAVGLGASWIVAERNPVPWWELDLVRVLNDLPGTVATVLDPVMQLGTVVAPLVIAVLVGVARRDVASGLATGAVGVVAWIAAKELKQVVDRDRPTAFLGDLVVREDVGRHLGYPSGHSAVAAATAVMVAAALPSRLRWIPAVVAGVVGVARIVHGVHLPADVVGGWSLGVLIGLLGLAVLDRTST